MLHDELWLEIFSWVPVKDVLSSISLVSKTWNTLANNPFLWNNFCKYHDLILPDTDDITDWKEFFKCSSLFYTKLVLAQ